MSAANMERCPERRVMNGALPLGVVAILALALWPALHVLGARWLKFDESYSHGFLVLVVSGFLCVQKWFVRRPVVGLYPWWLIPLALAALGYLAGSLLLIEALQQIAIIPLLIGALLLIWGWRQTSAFFLPIGLLLFTLPVWDYLSWSLQLVTVAVNQFLLSFLDIEFVVEGIFVFFPGVGAFEIAHGCSGLRYLLVGLTLCTLYGELNYRTVRSRVLLIAAGIALALAANWIRVVVIIYIGYESNMTSSLIDEHDFFGWWVFAGTLVPLFFFARALENRERSSNNTVTDSVDTQKQTDHPGWPVVVGGVVVPVLLLAAGSWYLELRNHSAAMTANGRQPAPLVDTSRWMPVFQSNLKGWSPSIQRPDRSHVNVYRDRTLAAETPDSPVEVLVGLYTYDFQRPNAEVVQYRNRLYPGGALIPEKSFDVDAGSGLTLKGMTLRYRQSEERLHIVYGYYVEGRWETNELLAKLAQLPGIFNARSDASLVIVGVSCSRCDGPSVLEELLPDVRARAQAYLDQLADQLEQK